jgi:hypothetical protein
VLIILKKGKSINSIKFFRLVKTREEELNKCIKKCLEGKWQPYIRNDIELPIYIEFYRQEKALNLSFCQDIAKGKIRITEKNKRGVWKKIENQVYGKYY